MTSALSFQPAKPRSRLRFARRDLGFLKVLHVPRRDHDVIAALAQPVELVVSFA
jgi:hypothetical protein